MLESSFSEIQCNQTNTFFFLLMIPILLWSVETIFSFFLLLQIKLHKQKQHLDAFSFSFFCFVFWKYIQKSVFAARLAMKANECFCNVSMSSTQTILIDSDVYSIQHSRCVNRTGQTFMINGPMVKNECWLGWNSLRIRFDCLHKNKKNNQTYHNVFVVSNFERNSLFAVHWTKYDMI